MTGSTQRHDWPAPAEPRKPAGIRVTVEDLATGEVETREVMDDYVLICAGRKYLAARRWSAPDAALENPRVAAAIAMIGRTGADEFQIRYCDEEPPTVWIAAARWPNHQRWEAAGALTPAAAVFRLCERVIDGGTCVHCGRPTAFAADSDTWLIDRLVCVYAWDPELRTYRRGCEGDQ